MRKNLIFISIIGMLMSVQCKRKLSILRFLEFKSDFDPTFLKSLDTIIDPKSDGQALSVDVTLIRNITDNIFARISAFVKTNGKSTSDKIFETDFNYCRLWDGFMSQAIGRIWYMNVKKYSNFPAECPIHAGRYYIKSMKIDKNSVPPFLVDGVYQSKTFLFMPKNDGVKEMVFNCSIEFQINRK